MYKKILVTLDGSEFAESSLEHAKAIAKGCYVPEVILFGVVEPLPQASDFGYMSGDAAIQAEKQALDWLKEYLAKTAGKLEGIAVRWAVARGRAADEILDYAAKSNVDLIIMTTHGRSGIARWALGSVADRVVRHAMVPVLTIPPKGAKKGK